MIYRTFILLLLILTAACNNTNSDANISEGTLKEYYDYWDDISAHELHLSKVAQEYYAAFGTNNDATVKAALEKFQEAQKKGIDLVLKKFPSGSIKFPFEQTGIESFVSMKSIYISGYDYPWSTAERNSFYITFEYEIKKTDLRFKSVRVEFYDVEGEIINACNITLEKTGKTTMYMKPEVEFRKFLKIKMVTTDI